MRRLVFVVAVFGSAVLLAQSGSGAVTRAVLANTWTGTWDRSGVGLFDITQSGTQLTGSWHWGTGGTVQGTLQPDGSVVGSWAGGSSSVTSGSINWDPLSADGKSFTGTSSYGSETRSWGGVCVSGACASNGTANPVPAVVVVPSASQWGVPVLGAVGPGATGVVSSPPLSTTSSVTVSLGGISPADLATLADIRHTCYVNFTKTVFTAVKLEAASQITDEFEGVAPNIVPTLIRVYLVRLADCVSYVDAVQAVLASRAAASAVQACAFVPVALSISGSGSTTRLRSFHIGSLGTHQALRVSCTRNAGGLTLAVASQSASTPLSSVVGPRLSIGIVRNRHDVPGGHLSVTFNRH